jgi:Acyltransferase family
LWRKSQAFFECSHIGQDGYFLIKQGVDSSPFSDQAGEMTETQTAAKTHQRLHGLDFLRALMMSLGVVLHGAQLYLTIPIIDYYWDPMRSPSMDAILIFINTFRMPTFYMLSGFFTALLVSRRGLGGMIHNRYKRLFIPFVVFLPVLALTMTGLRIVGAHLMTTGEWGFDLSLVSAPGDLWNNTHNLWFLYYLMMYVLSAWLLITASSFLPERTTRWTRNKLLARPLYSLTMILIVSTIWAALGSLSTAGRISGTLSFVPSLLVFSYFGVAFVVGWLLYLRIDDIQVLIARAWHYLTLAMIFLAIALLGFAFQGEPGDSNYIAFHSLLSLCTGLSMTMFVLGLPGLFSRYYHNHSPWIRYFSDSAYWVFILHSIPMVVIALLMHSWMVPAEIKFLIVCTVTFLICLVSYHYWVRNTWIGELLNGRRYQNSPLDSGRET